MEARTSGHKILGTLLTGEFNAWGYFQTPEGLCINVGYANVGLIPQAVLVDRCVIVGIDECLVGYDLLAGASYFSYRMPFMFHEFVEVGDLFIVRDEMGFVGLASDGSERWKFCTEDTIENYVVTSSSISGKTADGLPFSFELPVFSARRQVGVIAANSTALAVKE
jgi:hypothetical protein